MPSPRYGRDRQRPRRRGAPGKRINPWYILAGGFFVVYLIFLVSWRFGNVANLEGSAPTEQLSNLRKASNPAHVQSDDALDVEIAAQLEEQRRNGERARQIPIKVVLPTTAPPTDAPVPTTAIPVTEKPRALEKVVADQNLEGRVPGMPMQAVEDAAKETPVVQVTEAAAGAKPAVVTGAPEYVATKAVPMQMEPAATPASVAARHQKISGYAEAKKFLENYQYNPDESLFLFFLCSDDEFKANNWSEECVKGKQHVYDVFSKSPGRNRLVTVFAGSENYWKHQNDFYNDADLRVKGVPTIMQWEGRSGRTSGMLVQRSLYDEPFLRYLFKNTDQPELLFAADDVKNKQIITVNGYDAYVDAMIKYEKEDNPVPTFLMMVSGRFRNNNRPWCPYCRYSELPLEYAFYTYAPKNARMIRVEVTDSYSEWRRRTEFTADENLQLKIVPLMFKIKQLPPTSPNGPRSIQFTQHKVRYDELASLRQLFSSFA
ncbi:hypothetical protein V7S43_008781 [Phytophthora oleae]|uniref:Thioredoxin domain-containing protein n=1 Tax=Phytophthora oleae TaxID=2107226 RepID=A0ABD3FI27_9STRA